MLVELGISLVALGGQWAYHRWFEDKPLKKIKPQEVSIPRADEGSPVPLIYGRVRVRSPILAWHGAPVKAVGDPLGNDWPTNMTFYQMDMLFVAGIPFNGAVGATTRFCGMWIGDRKCVGLIGPAGVGPGLQTQLELNPGSQDVVDEGTIGQQMIMWDGSPSQAPVLALHARQLAEGVPAEEQTSYLGYVTFLLHDNFSPWTIGSSTSIAGYSPEIATYFDLGSYPAPGIQAQIGMDSNPVNVLWDLLTGGGFGKLDLDPSLLDFPSFQAAAATLFQESHGYSMCFEDSTPAVDKILDVLRQIDGGLDVDPATGKLVLKLVRPDFNPADIFHITKDNCTKLVGVTIGGWPDVVNNVGVIYEDREQGYADATEFANNQGNLARQGSAECAMMEFRGAKYASLAKALANRELGVKSAPVFKFRAIMNREARSLRRCDPVKVTYKGIAGMIMRVADVDRGTRDDRTIAVDLVSDPFYTWRNETPQSPWLPTDIEPQGMFEVG